MAATSQLENAIASVNVHVAAQLASYTLEFPGADLDTEAQTAWIRVDFLAATRSFIRSVSSTEKGYLTYIPVSFNCFSKESDNSYRVLELRDAVFNAMKPMTSIDFTDHAGASASLGTMTAWEVINDTPLETRDGIRGHNITISVRYEEQF